MGDKKIEREIKRHRETEVRDREIEGGDRDGQRRRERDRQTERQRERQKDR